MNEAEVFSEPLEGYQKERDFTSLLCVQNARKMKLFFYNKIIPKLPQSETNNLINQIQRAAVCSTANISEGYGRYHYQEGIQYFRISRGSTYEMKDHLISCFDFNYIDKKLFDEGIDLIESTKIKLNGYIKYLHKLKENSKKQKRS